MTFNTYKVSTLLSLLCMANCAKVTTSEAPPSATTAGSGGTSVGATTATGGSEGGNTGAGGQGQTATGPGGGGTATTGPGGAGGSATAPPWAYSFGNEGKQIVTQVTATSDGGVIALGSYVGKLTLGSLQAENKKPCNGTDGPHWLACPDAFIAKIDGQQNMVWAHNFSSKKELGVDYPYRLNLRPDSQEVVVHLSCQSLMVKTMSGTKELASAGTPDLCLIKIDGSGNVVAAKAWGNNTPYGVQVGKGVATSQGLAITVYTGDINVNGTPYKKGIHLLRFGYDLSFLSSTFLYTNNGGTPHAIATDHAGHLYITSSFSGSITWPDASTSTTEPGAVESFVSGWASPGTLLWHSESKSSMGAYGSHNALALQGDKLVTVGSFAGSIDLGTGKLNNASDPNCLDDYNNTGNCQDAFLAIYNRHSGTLQSAIHLESKDDLTLWSVAAAPGRILLGGNMRGASATLQGTSISNNAPGKWQMLIAELDDKQLLVQKHKTLGSLATDLLTSLDLGPKGRIWAGGLLGGTTALIPGMDSVVKDAPNAFILSTDSL